MVKEAEEHAEADRLAKERVEARNQLESYLYGLRSTVQDSLKDKLSESDKESILKAVNDGLHWVEEHPSATKEEYDEKKQEVEAIASPIITQAYKGASPSSNDNDDHDPEDDSSSGPTVEEVD